MYKSIVKWLKNPKVQQALLWLVPLVLGWLFDKSKNNQTAPKASSRKKAK